jgi:hypothetical protein
MNFRARSQLKEESLDEEYMQHFEKEWVSRFFF